MTKEGYELKLKLIQQNHKNNAEEFLYNHEKLLEEYIQSLEEQIIPNEKLINILYQSCYNAGIRGELTLFEKQVTKIILEYVSIEEMLDRLNITFKHSKPILDVVTSGIPYVKELIDN